MKLCKDCKHIAPGQMCNHPKNYRIVDAVTGAKIPTMYYCRNHRQGGWVFALIPPQTCGEAGRWFEPKEAA